MEELTEYVAAFAAGVLFCIAIWLLFAQVSRLPDVFDGFSMRSLEVMYVW